MKLLIFVLPPEYDHLCVGVWCFAAVVVCLFVCWCVIFSIANQATLRAVFLGHVKCEAAG